MIRSYLVLVLALTVLAPAALAGPQEDAAASLALARALQSVRDNDAAKQPVTSWEEAQRLAKSTGKPLFVRVGDCDCSAVCNELRPAIITAHLTEWKGDSKAKTALVLPDANGVLWWVHEWAGATVPKPADVRKAIEDGKASIKTAKPAAKKVSLVGCDCAGPLSCTCESGTCDCAKCVATKSAQPQPRYVLYNGRVQLASDCVGGR